MRSRSRPRTFFILLLLIIETHLFTGCSSLFTNKEPQKPTEPIPGQVILPWNGDPNVTFNVYRRSENGNDIKINSEPVKPMNLFSGGKKLVQFQYVDRTVLVGEEYYYTLEEIDKDGHTSLWESPRKMVATAIPEHTHSG
jgi:hypothetical protein